jgi:hypothetical protein
MLTVKRVLVPLPTDCRFLAPGAPGGPPKSCTEAFDPGAEPKFVPLIVRAVLQPAGCGDTEVIVGAGNAVGAGVAVSAGPTPHPVTVKSDVFDVPPLLTTTSL